MGPTLCSVPAVYPVILAVLGQHKLKGLMTLMLFTDP